MSVLTNTYIVKTATNICNEDEFKRDIFLRLYVYLSTNQEDKKILKRIWDQNVRKKALRLLTAYNLGEKKEELVVGAVMSIALRMLIWIEFYIGTFNFPREFCIEFLDSSLFTSEGMIDSNKVAIKMSRQTLSNLQDFQLASFYSQYNRIPRLFENLCEEDKNLVYNENYPNLIRQPSIIKFWSWYYKGTIEKLQGNITELDRFRLKSAIYSGSKLAVEYCLKKRQSYLVDIAVSVVIYRMERELIFKEGKINFVDDWVVFQNQTYTCQEVSWAPDCFFTYIFYSLLSQMSDTQKSVMMGKLFEFVDSVRVGKSNYIKILDHFLCWPYQDQFLSFVNLSWKFLPERVFGHLLLEIVSRIEPEVDYLWKGEEKMCNYRKLLMEVWISSPSRFKVYAFSDKKRKVQNEDGSKEKIVANEGKELLLRILQLPDFTEKDIRNVTTILESLTQKEKRCFISSKEGAMVCEKLIKKGLDDVFEELIFICCESSENSPDFRKKLALQFVMKEIWNESWVKLCLMNSSAADRFARLCVNPSESKTFKNLLLFSEDGITMCKNVLKNGITVLADKLINWCMSTQDEINKFKETLALRTEISYNCNYNLEAIEGCSVEKIPNHIVDWDSSKTFLSWSFQSESEINSFKRKYLENAKEKIILKFIDLDKEDIANKFISWLNLPPEEEEKMRQELFFT